MSLPSEVGEGGQRKETGTPVKLDILRKKLSWWGKCPTGEHGLFLIQGLTTHIKFLRTIFLDLKITSSLSRTLHSPTGSW